MNAPALLNAIDDAAWQREMAEAPAFPHFCIDDFLDPAFAAEVHDAFPSYDDALGMGRSFNAVNEKRKIQITDSSKFPAPILALHELLASDEFVQRLSQVSGVPNLLADPGLSGGGIHETNGGGRLDVHIDFNYNEEMKLFRRLNLLIYFNRDWKDEYGGVLDLWDRDVKHCVGRYAPVFNRCVGFETSEISWHGVTPLACPPDVVRKSFAVYYYTREAPPGWDGAKHSTVFKARPSEFLRGAIAMPGERALNATREKLRSVARQVKKAL